MSTPTVGFIGLGAMGEPMAAHLRAAGSPVVSCVNRSREAIERLSEARIEERPAAAAGRCYENTLETG